MTSILKKLPFGLLASALLLVGCSQRFQKGPHQYLIPFLNEDGSYSWREVEITTLNSPTKLEGSTAVIHYNPTSAGSRSWGPPMEPKLKRSGDVWVPLDTPSAVALSTYATLEAIRRWEASVHPAAESVYPRKIILELSARGADGPVVDNAFFEPRSNVMVFVPFRSSGIPLSVNQGVVAHEHFHAQFHHQMFRSTLQILDEKFSGLSLDLKLNVAYNLEVLRAWNEGLADFYAYSFTHQPRFFDVSKLTMPGSSLVRALDFAFESLSEKFMSETANNKDTINDKGDTCLAGSPYCLGTQVARMLYQMSEGNPSKAHSLLRALYESFPSWQKSLNDKIFNEKLKTDEFIRWTFSNAKEKLSANQCAVLQKATGDSKSLLACGGVVLP